MKKLAPIICFTFALLSGNACAETIGKWNKGEVEGFTRYWTTNSKGANFVVWCHPTRNVNGTLLSIVIDGQMPEPDTRMKLILDREILELPVNSQGYVESACATCSDSFSYVWHRLRSSFTLAAKFHDFRYATFSLRGAKNILPSSPCPTDWEKKKAGN